MASQLLLERLEALRPLAQPVDVPVGEVVRRLLGREAGQDPCPSCGIDPVEDGDEGAGFPLGLFAGRIAGRGLQCLGCGRWRASVDRQGVEAAARRKRADGPESRRG